MLYVLAGHGTANGKEIFHTLQTLKDAAEGLGEEFWMILAQPGPDETVSDTERGIIHWLQDKAIYWEAVVSGGPGQVRYSEADEIHESRKPVDLLIKLAKYRVQPGEPSAVLILSDDIDHDDTALFAIERAIEEGIPVYDLTSQMIQLELLEKDEESEPLPVLDSTENLVPPVETVPEPPAAPVFTREDLESLTREELKTLVRAQEKDALVRDMRSKEAIISVLLGESEAPTAPVNTEEPVQETSSPLEGLTVVEPAEDPTQCFLLVVRENGQEIRRLSQRATMCLMAILAEEAA